MRLPVGACSPCRALTPRVSQQPSHLRAPHKQLFHNNFSTTSVDHAISETALVKTAVTALDSYPRSSASSRLDIDAFSSLQHCHERTAPSSQATRAHRRDRAAIITARHPRDATRIEVQSIDLVRTTSFGARTSTTVQMTRAANARDTQIGEKLSAALIQSEC